MNDLYITTNPGSVYTEPEISDSRDRHVWWLGHTYLGMTGLEINGWEGIVGVPKWLEALAQVQRMTRAKGEPRRALLRVARATLTSQPMQDTLEALYRLGGPMAAQRWVRRTARKLGAGT
jgi:hypothetical protein